MWVLYNPSPGQVIPANQKRFGAMNRQLICWWTDFFQVYAMWIGLTLIK